MSKFIVDLGDTPAVRTARPFTPRGICRGSGARQEKKDPQGPAGAVLVLLVAAVLPVIFTANLKRRRSIRWRSWWMQRAGRTKKRR